MGAERQLVSREKTSFDVEYKTLKEILKEVNDLIQTYGEDAYVQMTQSAYSDGAYLAVFAKELETDEEYEIRLVTEERYSLLQEEQDKKKYEILKKKYEGK
jgi:hypothetical protein